MRAELENNCMLQTVTLRSAAARLNDGVGGVIVLTDDDGIVRGLLTDGDLRRALLRNFDLDAPVSSAMNTSFEAASQNASRQELIRRLGPKIRHLPVVDAAGQLVDLLSWTDLWNLPVSEPSLGGNELKYLANCIETVWISSQGRYIPQFENMMAEFIGAPHALATTSGTTALHLALASLEIGAGDEVIVPAVTFGATANAVILAGARPLFADIDPVTKTLSVEGCANVITPQTRAIIPVHLYGHPCDMDPLIAFARAHNQYVIEDCAEALGARYKGARVGGFGDVSCFSFFANKVITTGEGGMVVTRDGDLHARMALLRDHGMTRERRYWHLEPGYNYRLTNMQAAIGVAQMEALDGFLAHRQRLAEVYRQALDGRDDLKLPPAAPWADNIFWLYTIETPRRDAVINALRKRGVDSRPVFPTLPQQPAFGAEPPGRFPVAEAYASSGISLPLSNKMALEDADYVADQLISSLQADRLAPVR